MTAEGEPTEASYPPLLPDPTSEQLFLIETVAAVYLRYGEWPGWAFVEEELERSDLNAEVVVTSLPREYTHQYGFIFPMRPVAPVPQDRIGLTIAGLARVPLAQNVVDSFLGFVSALGRIRSRIKLDPFSDTRPIVTKAQLTAVRFPTVVDDSVVLAMMQKEPATWNCQVTNLPADDWQIEVTPGLRRFAGVASADDYLNRLRDQMSPVREDPSPAYQSPFTLPAAIDYLDIVWQRRFDTPLVVPPGVERSARLAFTATSPDEADTRLSALAELLKNLRIPPTPGVGGHPIPRLEAFLTDQLPEESHARIRDALAVLDAARQLRAGGQHSGARASAVSACQVLGILFPVQDWSTAWQQIQNAVAVAVDAIRDELQASDS